jgi:HSP20 family protein
MSYPAGRPSPYGGRSVQGWDPFGELQTLRADLGRLLGGRGSASDIDVEEGDGGWTITARLPGVAPEEVVVELDERELCIRARSEAEVNAELSGEETGSRRRSFDYRVSLPGDIDEEEIDATMDHGLLVVRLTRSTRSRRRQISIGRRDAKSES